MGTTGLDPQSLDQAVVLTCHPSDPQSLVQAVVLTSHL
jgi:hypothetical protein